MAPPQFLDRIPAAPQPAFTCAAAPAAATARHPAACAAIGFIGPDQSGTTHVTRETNTSSATAPVTESVGEDWSATPNPEEAYYRRTGSVQVSEADGRLFETRGSVDLVELSPVVQAISSSRTVTAYSYDIAGHLSASATSTRMLSSESPDPFAAAEIGPTTAYFVDARGTAFDNDGTKFAFFPDGTVQSTSNDFTTCGGGCQDFQDVNRYDDSGRLVEADQTGFDRAGNVRDFSSTAYSYDGDRLTSIVEGPGALLTTAYAYDAAGNNVSRTKTTNAGALLWTWTGTYDAAGNLVCELQVDDAGNLMNIVHYDYGCF